MTDGATMYLVTSCNLSPL